MVAPTDVSADDLRHLTRKELQAMCKTRGIKANGKTEELIGMLTTPMQSDSADCEASDESGESDASDESDDAEESDGSSESDGADASDAAGESDEAEESDDAEESDEPDGSEESEEEEEEKVFKDMPATGGEPLEMESPESMTFVKRE
ncbi:hypothetical protein IWQ56_007167, partial [Coemansia nantahalensis]